MPVSCTLHTMTQGHFLIVYTTRGSLVTKVPCLRLTIYVAIRSPFNIAVPTLKNLHNIFTLFKINYNQVLEVRPVKPMHHIKFRELRTLRSSVRMCMALSTNTCTNHPLIYEHLQKKADSFSVTSVPKLYKFPQYCRCSPACLLPRDWAL